MTIENQEKKQRNLRSGCRAALKVLRRTVYGEEDADVHQQGPRPTGELSNWQGGKYLESSVFF